MTALAFIWLGAAVVALALIWIASIRRRPTDICERCGQHGEGCYEPGRFGVAKCYFFNCPNCGHQWGHSRYD